MGASASIDGMGLPDSEVKALLTEMQGKRFALGSKQREFLNAQKSNMFKNHGEMIKIVTQHNTKQSIKDILIQDSLTVDILCELSGSSGTDYSFFLNRLAHSNYPDIKISDLQQACSGIGMDSESIALTILTSTTKEIETLVSELKSNLDIDIVEIAKTRLKPDSLLQTLLLELLGAGVKPPQSIKPKNLIILARDLLNAEPEEFIRQLSSFTQDTINDLTKLYKEEVFPPAIECTTLESIIENKFGAGTTNNNDISNIVLKSVVKQYLQILIQPNLISKVAEIMIQLCTNNNKDGCIKTLTCYESNFLDEVNNIIKQRTDKTLSDILIGPMGGGGKAYQIANAWITSSNISNVKNNENKILKYIEKMNESNVSLTEIVSDADKCHDLQVLIKSCNDELDIAINDIFTLSKAATDEVAADGKEEAKSEVEAGMKAEEEATPEVVAKTLTKQKSMKFEILGIKDENGDSFLDKLDLVTGYMMDICAAADYDNNGTIPYYQFWSIFSSLNVAHMCYNQEEIDLMPEMTYESHSENGMLYYEDAIPEIADGMIAGMEARNNNVREVIENEIKACSGDQLQALLDETSTLSIGIDDTANAVAAAETVPETVFTSSLPPDLMSHLQNTFEAFDTSNSGYLSRDDFWSLINMLNLNLFQGNTDATTAWNECFSKFDANGDGHIEWMEALPKFDEIIHEMASDQRDHWIGLEDTTVIPADDNETPVTRCFWYNILDGASQWMSVEEQAQYKQFIGTGGDSSELKGPSVKKKRFNRVGVIAIMNHLKNNMADCEAKKKELEENTSISAAEKSVIMEKIEIDYTENVSKLKKQQIDAKKLLDQRMDADKSAHAKRLRDRLDKKKRLVKKSEKK